MTNIEMQNYFDGNLKTLDEQAVNYLNQYDPGPINNVLIGMNKFCFGITQWGNNSEFQFELLYVNGENKIEGYALSLDLENDYRNEILASYANLIFSEFSCHTGVSEIFNTYQHYIRTVLEKKGVFTLDNELLKKNSSIWLKGNVEGVTPTPRINELELARFIFSDQQVLFDDNRENKIYLKHNPRNGLTKIGRSISPSLREKTLQGEDPVIEFIAIWQAPRKVEKELHKEFDHKRVRGEWFNLNHADFNLIKVKMESWS